MNAFEQPPVGNPLGDEERVGWRPERCDRIALVLQGGGALGAYQAGVYEALHEAADDADQRRLSRPVWTKQGEDFAPANVEIDRLQGVMPAGVNLVEVRHDHDWVHGETFAKELSGSANRHLEQAPKKLIDFFDKSLLQHFDLERFLIVRTIPFERKALASIFAKFARASHGNFSYASLKPFSITRCLMPS